jgi:hypothetical protein
MDAMTTPPLSPANLSQPEPQGATKGELSQLYRKHGGFNYDGMDEIEFENAVNEAIARWGRSAIEPQSENCPGCEGTPAANNSPCTVCGQLAQPEPQGQQGLIDEELTEFAEEWWRSFQYLEAGAEAATPITDIVHSWHFVDFSHAVLARFGRPTIKPVPVAERLPGPEDCDEEGLMCNGGGWCWWFEQSSQMWVADFYSSHYTHWLSHWALPVPTAP